MNSNRLSLSITHADGRVSRWGPDEPNAEDLPNDLTFSTSIPGGFKDCTTSLLRRITQDYDDLNLFDTVRIYGPGGQTAWEGRTTQFPRSHGDGFSITPGAVGWSAHLLDDPSFREVYVDRDLSHWRGMSLGQRVSLATWRPVTDGTQITDTSPGLLFELDGPISGSGATSEAWYDAGPGLTVKQLAYSSLTTQLISGGVWDFRSEARDLDDGSGSFSSFVTHGNANTVAYALYTAATGRRYARIVDFFPSTAASDITRFRTVAQIMVIGGHGLTLRGSDPDKGVYASDVVANIVTRTAPLLNLGDIEATTFVIPHLVFDQPTTGSDAILFTNAYHQFDWGVYDNREFFYRAPDPDRLTWEARLSEGARVDLEGDTAEQIFNGVYVTYTDATGAQKTVGPPGAGADATDATLADTSADNPVNAAGIPRRWALLNISQTTSQAGAIQLGYVWLAEHSLPQRRGTLKLTGTATHPTEGKVPVWRVRAGDFVRISDHPADVPRKIIETSYSHANGGVLSATLDNTSAKLDSILERLGVAAIGIF